MKKSTTAKMLSGALAFATLVTPLAATMGCDTGTNSTPTPNPAPEPEPEPTPEPVPETARDFTITGYPKIIIHGLPSLAEPYINDFKSALDTIYNPGTSGAMIIRFRNYVDAITNLKITVENVPEYESGYNFRIISRNEFAVRSEYLATKPNIAALLLSAVNNMNNQYNVVVEQKTWTLDCGIPLENESNASIAATVSKVNGAIGLVNARLASRIKDLPGAKIIVESGDYENFNRDENAVKISVGSLNANDQTQLSGILKNAFSEIAELLGEYYFDYNVKVVNETGGDFRDGLIEDITTALDYFAEPSYEFFSISDVSDRYPEVIITNGTDGASGEAFDGDTVKIGKEYIPDDYYVYVMLETTLTNMLERPDPKAVSQE